MAMISSSSSSVRRALLIASRRNISSLLLLPRPSTHDDVNSPFSSSHARNVFTVVPAVHSNVANNYSAPPSINFMFQSRRGFAKGRKQWVDDEDESYDDEDEDEVDYGRGGGGSKVEIVNVGPSIKAAGVTQMEAAIDTLSHELSKLRTGRASAGMLDHIIVETDGMKMPLGRMAVVSVLDSKTLSISPYSADALKALEKAIISSPLGLSPKPDGHRLIATIPPMTKEHMQAVCKVVAKSSEDVKQSIRRARQKALDTIKRSLPKKMEGKDKRMDKGKGKEKKREKDAVSGFSLDDAKRLEKEVEELTKKFIKSAEEICKAKEKEITSS